MLNKVNETFKDIYNAIDEMEATINEQRAEIRRLRDMEQMDQLLIKELLGKSEQLLKERDEVRRMWCEAEAVGNCLSMDDMKRRARTEAKRRGWDCFKEETQ